MVKYYDLKQHYSNQLTRFIRFDSIRILKILELCQFVIFGVFMGMFFAKFIHTYLAVYFVEENYVTEEYPEIDGGNRNPILILHILYDLFLVAISTYYLRKLAQLVPFVFSFVNKNYIPNKKGEGTAGLIVGLGMVYMRGLSNFQKRLDLLVGDIAAQVD